MSLARQRSESDASGERVETTITVEVSNVCKWSAL